MLVQEACAFRDDYSSFSGKAKLFGISNDSVDANGKFQQAQKLPYPLLSDESGKLRKAFGIKGNLLGLIPGRQVTFNAYAHLDSSSNMCCLKG